uniref:Uncharacterized protein n=1 Tax=Manihot esculenta TaxID=3983 RepID=A0A2C9VDT1_MANES
MVWYHSTKSIIMIMLTLLLLVLPPFLPSLPPPPMIFLFLPVLIMSVLIILALSCPPQVGIQRADVVGIDRKSGTCQLRKVNQVG